MATRQRVLYSAKHAFFFLYMCAITQHGQLRSPWLVVMQKQSHSHDEVRDPLATTVVKNAISCVPE